MKHARLTVALAALALSAPLVVSAVNAQTSPTGTPRTATGTTTGTASGTAATQATNYAQFFLDRLAAALGVNRERLNTAIQQSSNATVDEALRNRDISNDQAARLRERAQNGQFGLFGPGGRGGFGPGRGFGFRGGFGGASLEAAAGALGLSAADLTAQLREGQTLSEIAQARGVTLEAVQNAVAEAHKARLDEAVAAGRLTQAQADEMLQNLRQDPNLGLRGGRGRGGFGELRGGPRI